MEEHRRNQIKFDDDTKRKISIVISALIVISILCISLAYISDYSNKRVFDIIKINKTETISGVLYTCHSEDHKTIIIRNSNQLFINKNTKLIKNILDENSKKNSCKLRITIIGGTLKNISKFPNIIKIEVLY